MRHLFLTSFIMLLIAGTVATVSAATPDPIVGTWKLDVGSSVFGGLPALKSQTRIYSGKSPNFSLKKTEVNAAGQETTTQTTYQLDGKDYPSMGNPDFDHLSGVQIDPNTAEFTLKRAGQAIGKIRRTVSEDGQTLKIHYLLTNAAGVKASALMVFHK
jgi:hypothetical protein